MITDDRFGVAFRVSVRGIDEVAAERDEPIQDLLGLFSTLEPQPLSSPNVIATKA